MNSYYNMAGWNTPNGSSGIGGNQWALGNRGNYGYTGGQQQQNAAQPWWYSSGNAPPGSQGNQWGFDLSQSPWGGDEFRNKLLQGLYPGGINNAAWLSGYAQPQFQNTVMDQMGLLSPNGINSRVSAFGTASNANAMNTGAQNAAQLRAMGLSNAAQAGALLDATNKSRGDINNYWGQVADPYQVNQQKMQLLGQAGQGPIYQSINSLLGMQQQPKQQQPSFLDSLFGLAGAAGSLGLGF